jgi:hypothetical protein
MPNASTSQPEGTIYSSLFFIFCQCLTQMWRLIYLVSLFDLLRYVSISILQV